MKRNFEESRNRINKLSDAVFGEHSEVDHQEAVELLNAAGVDLDEFEGRLYKQLYERAQKYWMAQKPLPGLLKRAIEHLRPASAPARNETELAKQARSVVERVLEQAKLLSQLVKGDQELSFAASYRNKSDISAKDKSILDNAQQEIRDKLKRSGDPK